MFNRVILYVEEEDGVYEAIMLDHIKWLAWQLREQAKLPIPEIESIPYIIEKIDFPMYEHDIDEESISCPLVPRKQLAAYSHKPKGVKRCYKTQKR